MVFLRFFFFFPLLFSRTSCSELDLNCWESVCGTRAIAEQFGAGAHLIRFPCRSEKPRRKTAPILLQVDVCVSIMCLCMRLRVKVCCVRMCMCIYIYICSVSPTFRKFELPVREPSSAAAVSIQRNLLSSVAFRSKDLESRLRVAAGHRSLNPPEAAAGRRGGPDVWPESFSAGLRQRSVHGQNPPGPFEKGVVEFEEGLVFLKLYKHLISKSHWGFGAQFQVEGVVFLSSRELPRCPGGNITYVASNGVP